MRLRKFVRVPLITAALALYACEGTDDETPAGYEGVELAGKVTDETLIALASALDQKAPVDAPSQRATLDAPADGASIPKSPVPSFSWHIGGSAGRAAPQPGSWSPRPSRSSVVAPSSSDPWVGLDPAPKGTAPSFVSLASPLRELFGPIRSAHAHGTPFTGTATFLVFSVDAEPQLVRVLTSETSYNPTQAAWDKIAAAGKTITLKLVTALFEQNRVIPDGGPFTGSSTTFTVTP